MLHLPLSFFGSYTQETRLMLDAYAGFLDRLKLSAILKRWPTVYFYRQTTGIVVYISLLWGRLLAPVSAPTNKEAKNEKAGDV